MPTRNGWGFRQLSLHHGPFRPIIFFVSRYFANVFIARVFTKIVMISWCNDFPIFMAHLNTVSFVPPSDSFFNFFSLAKTISVVKFAQFSRWSLVLFFFLFNWNQRTIELNCNFQIEIKLFIFNITRHRITKRVSIPQRNDTNEYFYAIVLISTSIWRVRNTRTIEWWRTVGVGVATIDQIYMHKIHSIDLRKHTHTHNTANEMDSEQKTTISLPISIHSVVVVVVVTRLKSSSHVILAEYSIMNKHRNVLRTLSTTRTKTQSNAHRLTDIDKLCFSCGTCRTLRKLTTDDNAFWKCAGDVYIDNSIQRRNDIIEI